MSACESACNSLSVMLSVYISLLFALGSFDFMQNSEKKY